MSRRSVPDWFPLADEIFDPLHQRLAETIQNHDLPIDLSLAPQEAWYFFLHSMQIAYDANKAGIHANALAQTRYCVEALSVIELGVSRATSRETILRKWLAGDLTPGNLRKKMAQEIWTSYGTGIWQETWEEFMGNLARAVQPYAHYTPPLAQWQSRLHGFDPKTSTAIIQSGPIVYDPQKATRITLYHAIMNYALCRIWLARFPDPDPEFGDLVGRFGEALGRSKYLEGHTTDWAQQFWAMTFKKDGTTILE